MYNELLIHKLDVHVIGRSHKAEDGWWTSDINQ